MTKPPAPTEASLVEVPAIRYLTKIGYPGPHSLPHRIGYAAASRTANSRSRPSDQPGFKPPSTLAKARLKLAEADYQRRQKEKSDAE